MKGLRKYIAKHGRHLTEQLAMDALECRWNIPEVVKATESRVRSYSRRYSTYG